MVPGWTAPGLPRRRLSSRAVTRHTIGNGGTLNSVCHVISGYFRNDARVFLRQCRSLRDHGFNVTVLTNDGEPDEVLDGISIFACPTAWPRWRTLAAAKRQFLGKALEINADVYQLHSPELLPLGLALKRAGKKVVYDAHEDMPRHLLEKEWLPPATRRVVSAAFERYMLRTLAQYDDIVSPHSHVVADFQRLLGKGVLIANFPLIADDWNFGRDQFAGREKILCYSGTVYAYSNQEETVAAIADFDGLRYHIAGYIDEDHRQRLAKMPGGEKVVFHGRLSRPALHAFYEAAVMGVVIYDYKLNLGDRLGSYGTNKIFEYMEAGLPFICTDYVLWKDIVDRYDCGVCVPPGDPDAIVRAIDHLLQDRDRAYGMGQNGRRAVLEEFNWSSEEKKYVDLFRGLCCQR